MLFIMNDIEKRRLKLLRETRKNYSDKYIPPAVHPRFHATYSTLYRECNDEETNHKSSFFIRTLIAVLLFALFFIMDYRNEKLGKVDSHVVIHEVQRNLLGK